MSPVLKSAHIKNFKSLGDVNLNFKSLTIIVGANSSGKSCCLESLNLLKTIVKVGKAPPSWYLEDDIRIGEESSGITLQVFISDVKDADYSVNLALRGNLEENFIIASENLTISKTKVINISKGKGEVRDENNKGRQPYQSTPDTVALSSTGSFGVKPVTKNVSNFIKQWEFYDLDPDVIKSYETRGFKNETRDNLIRLDSFGHQLQGLLQHWASDSNDQLFKDVSDEIQQCLNIDLISGHHKGKQVIKIKEKNGLEIPFSNLSDGTLRMIGYCSLLYSPDIPSLIAIEEPERNLHPGILKDLASILKRLSQKTQVVITTHSSQLLDCFDINEISSDVSVILVKKNLKLGTEAIGLDKLSQDCDGLRDWMQDFGIGSAIYHSNLIQEVLAN
ncbi:MAG: ATP-binding protein [Pseudanabaenaceae cyanobacterium bins.39]|nr:ATP-binding protein [Pseudanabaenaceae cyanobacterium bins.39]